MVGSIPVCLRSRRRNPTVCSTSAIALETEGCEIARSVAAFPMVPDFATASRMCRSRNLSRRPTRSVHCMVILIPEWLWDDQTIELPGMGWFGYCPFVTSWGPGSTLVQTLAGDCDEKASIAIHTGAAVAGPHVSRGSTACGSCELPRPTG